MVRKFSPQCFYFFGDYNKLQYEGEVNGDMPNGEGILTIKRNHQIIYEGGFKDGFFHGKGTYYDKGFKFMTDWNFGIATGKVHIVTPHEIFITTNVHDGLISLGGCLVKVPNSNRSFFGSYNLDEGTDGMFTEHGEFYSGEHDVTEQVLNDPNLQYIKKVPAKNLSDVELNQTSILTPILTMESAVDSSLLKKTQSPAVLQNELSAMQELRRIAEKLHFTDDERAYATTQTVLKEIEYFLKNRDNTM